MDLGCIEKKSLNQESRIDFSRQADAFRGVSDKPSPIAYARGCDVLSVSLIPLEHSCIITLKVLEKKNPLI